MGPQGPEGDEGPPGAGPINLADVYPKTASVIVNAQQEGVVEAFCNSGDVVIGGSCDAQGGDGHTTFIANRPKFPQPPDGPGSRGWTCDAVNYGTIPAQTLTINAHAICYNVP